MNSRGSRILNLIFPVSYLSSQLSMTGLLIVLGLDGNPQFAADVAIVQAAALALYFAFSGNARNLIFKAGPLVSARSLLLVRLVLMLPLGIGVFYLGSILGGVAWDISLILILRKSVEWLNEIHLSEVEREQDTSFAWKHLILQLALIGVVVLWIATKTPGLMLIFTAWAIAPLFISASYLQTVLKRQYAIEFRARTLLPHLGSTAVVGISVYVFRLVLLMVVDKAAAGDLFTAFAIGGVLGSVFAMGLGPSLVLHEQRTGQRQMPTWLGGALILAMIAGISLALVSHFAPDLEMFSVKDAFFWQAIGLSLVGGVMMVLAQRHRLRDLQNGTEDDVFAPDVLANISIVAIIPIIFLAFGRIGLSWLYLLNAMIALVFYGMTDFKRAIGSITRHHANRLRVGLAVLLVLPVFVSLKDGLFRGVRIPSWNSGGDFQKLPIPLSVFGCYLGIVLLGNFRRANLGLAMIFLSFTLMVLSTVVVSPDGQLSGRSKLILLMQYLLPMFGLVLGMMFEDHRQDVALVEKAMLVVVAAVVPSQLILSWSQGYVWLSSYVYLFSIYQHLQYVPVIVVGVYLVALYSLWCEGNWRRLIIALAPVMGIYVAASASMLAAAFIVGGTILFAIYRIGIANVTARRGKEWIIALLVLIAWPAYYLLVRYLPDIIANAFSKGTYLYIQKFTLEQMPSVQDRIGTWLFYLRGIFSSPATFLLGHIGPPDRGVWASAHNYYLDFIYNFGGFAMLAIIGLVVFTAIRLYQERRAIMMSPSLIGLTVVVMFLVIPDNLLKVGMREPYSGIMTFFLWGLLLARIEKLRAKSGGVGTLQVPV